MARPDVIIIFPDPPDRPPLPEGWPAPGVAVTDIVSDPNGTVVVDIAVRQDEARRRADPGRRPDPEFDQALMNELGRRKIQLGKNKACIGVAEEVATALARNVTRPGLRTRIARLLRRARQLGSEA
jgi:hypothetical protein